MVDYSKLIKIYVVQNMAIPCIRDTSIPIYSVLSLLAKDISVEEILKDYSKLTRQDILACLAFAANQQPRPMILRKQREEHLLLLIQCLVFFSLCFGAATFYVIF